MQEQGSLVGFLAGLGKIIEERGVLAMLLVDAKGEPILVPLTMKEPASACLDEADAALSVRTYTLTVTCGRCKNGKRKCCEQMGGETLCHSEPC